MVLYPCIAFTETSCCLSIPHAVSEFLCARSNGKMSNNQEFLRVLGLSVALLWTQTIIGNEEWESWETKDQKTKRKKWKQRQQTNHKNEENYKKTGKLWDRVPK